MVVTSYIKLFRNGFDKHSSILTSLLLLVADITAFTTKFDKETSHIRFQAFESFDLFQNNYYKLWQKMLQTVRGWQNETEFITRCGKKLLQSVTGIKKCGSYYKVRHNTLSSKTLDLAITASSLPTILLKWVGRSWVPVVSVW